MSIQNTILLTVIAIGALVLSSCGTRATDAKGGTAISTVVQLETELNKQKESISSLQDQLVALGKENQRLNSLLTSYGFDAGRLSLQIKELRLVDENGTMHLRMGVDTEQQAVLFLGQRPILGNRGGKAVVLGDALFISSATNPAQSITITADEKGPSIFMSDQGRSTIVLQTGTGGDPGISLIGTNAKQMIVLGLSKSEKGDSLLLLAGNSGVSTTRIAAGSASGIILKDDDGQRVFTTVAP